MDCESVIKTAFEERHLCSKIPKQPCKVDFFYLGKTRKKTWFDATYNAQKHSMESVLQNWQWSHSKLKMFTGFLSANMVQNDNSSYCSRTVENLLICARGRKLSISSHIIHFAKECACWLISTLKMSWRLCRRKTDLHILKFSHFGRGPFAFLSELALAH